MSQETHQTDNMGMLPSNVLTASTTYYYYRKSLHFLFSGMHTKGYHKNESFPFRIQYYLLFVLHLHTHLFQPTGILYIGLTAGAVHFFALFLYSNRV